MQSKVVANIVLAKSMEWGEIVEFHEVVATGKVTFHRDKLEFYNSTKMNIE